LTDAVLYHAHVFVNGNAKLFGLALNPNNLDLIEFNRTPPRGAAL
jgi:hypothetical protein